MNILQRLKLQLGNRKYFEDEQYQVFLSENDLNWNAMYRKEVHQVGLLKTNIDVFEALINDVDIMTAIATEMGSTSAAYDYLKDRIANLKEQLDDMEEDCEHDPWDPFSLMITRHVGEPRLIRVNTQRSEQGCDRYGQSRKAYHQE